jgi:hypothetical protein
MAKMIVGVYSKNISFTENKSLDLYITIENKNLFFSVKSIQNGQFLAFLTEKNRLLLSIVIYKSVDLFSVKLIFFE